MKQPHPLDLIFRNYFQSLVTSLSRKWPNVSHADLEDAVTDAFEVLLANPKQFEEAIATGGVNRVVGLLSTISWRQLRASYRRSRVRPMVGVDRVAPSSLSQPAGQPLATHLSREWRKALRSAAEQVSEAHQDELVRALEDKFSTGDPDTKVALRHSVRREYLCRAKNIVMSQMRMAG